MRRRGPFQRALRGDAYLGIWVLGWQWYREKSLALFVSELVS